MYTLYSGQAPYTREKGFVSYYEVSESFAHGGGDVHFVWRSGSLERLCILLREFFTDGGVHFV